MVVIRLTRIGKKKQAFYRVVAADSQRFVNSKFIEILGWYNPKTKEVNLKADRVADWLSKGAQPSNTAAKLLKSNGIKLPDWVKISEKVSKPKHEPEVKEEAPKAAPAVEAVEEVAPVEEAKTEEQTPAEEAISDEAAEEIKEEAEAVEEAPAE